MDDCISCRDQSKIGMELTHGGVEGGKGGIISQLVKGFHAI